MQRKLLICLGSFVLFGVLGISPVRAVPTQDVPDPFVTTVTVNPVTNFNYTLVPLPAGMRLVIDYVSLSGAAESTSGAIQPIVILNTQLNGGTNNLFYFAPPQNAQLPTQFYSSEKTVIYADTLYVGPAFAGFTPSFDTFNVVISGHLIPNPQPPGAVTGPLSAASSERPKVTPARIGITAPPEP
jgi:hypothetical protein